MLFLFCRECRENIMDLHNLYIYGRIIIIIEMLIIIVSALNITPRFYFYFLYEYYLSLFNINSWTK